MKVTRILSVAMVLAASLQGAAQIPVKVESFPISNVRLTASPFKHAEDMDIQYLLGINPDRLLAPYLKEAGLQPKADNYTNWENTGLDGHNHASNLDTFSLLSLLNISQNDSKYFKILYDYNVEKEKLIITF